MMGYSHTKCVQETEGFECAAICDISEDALQRIGDEFEVSDRYTNYESMLEGVKDLDTVAVATHTRDHIVPTIAALERGISVLCEKPIAISPAEADQMVASSRASGAKLSINHQGHVSAGIRKAITLIDDGLIGEIVMVRGRNKAGRPSGNEFMEIGTHITDWLIQLGGEPVWVSGTVYCQKRRAKVGDIMDARELNPKDRDSGLVAGTSAVATYGFSGGVHGEINFIGYEQEQMGTYGVEIWGTKGQLAFRVDLAHLDRNLWHLPRPTEGLLSDLGDWELVDVSEMGIEDPQVTMYRHLARAIESGDDPPCHGESARMALEMVLGIYQSHREEGRRIQLPLGDRRHPLELWRKEEGPAR